MTDPSPTPATIRIDPTVGDFRSETTLQVGWGGRVLATKRAGPHGPATVADGVGLSGMVVLRINNPLGFLVGMNDPSLDMGASAPTFRMAAYVDDGMTTWNIETLQVVER